MTAAAIGISSFAALASSAAADGDSYVFASADNGIAQTGADGIITGITSGTRYFNEKRDSEYRIDSGVSAALKAQFDGNNDNIIDDIYCSQYIDYVKSASINVSLSAGVYTIYFVGVNAGSVGTVTAGTDTLPSGSRTTLHTGEGKKNLDVYTIKNVCFPGGFSGDIVFDNSNNWLPDITAVKIVRTEKTQNDIIVVDDITRPGRETNFVALSGGTANDKYDTYRAAFGNEFLGGITKFANYTDSDDYYYVRVTEPGSYKFDILSENTTQTDFNIVNASTGAEMRLNHASLEQVGTYASGNIYAGRTSDYVYLAAGIYKVNLIKVGSYYSNLIAAAMEKVAVDASCTYTIAVPTVTQYSGDPATGIEAAFIVNAGSGAVRSITWTATSAERKTVSAGYSGAVLGEGTYTFGLVVPKAISGEVGAAVTNEINCTFN